MLRKVEEAVDRLKGREFAPDAAGAPDTVILGAPGAPGTPPLVPGRQRALMLHMLATYRLLRRGMGWIAILYPVALLVVGYGLFDVAWQPSISNYYYALPRAFDFLPECGPSGALGACAAVWTHKAQASEMSFPLRALFCGGLIAIGVFLILYKGTSWLEDWALDLAGLFAIGVAVFPMNKVPFSSIWPTWLHFACAVLLFLCMWFVSRFCAKDTLRFFPAGSPERERYTKLYKRLAIAMLGVLGLGAVYGFAREAFDTVFPYSLFCIEAAGVAVFGSYWVIKSKEISKHDFGLPIDA